MLIVFRVEIDARQNLDATSDGKTSRPPSRRVAVVTLTNSDVSEGTPRTTTFVFDSPHESPHLVLEQSLLLLGSLSS